MARAAGSAGDVSARERYALTAVVGSLIVAAFAWQAAVLAGSVGWVAYPLVAAVGAASFLLARAAWNRLTAALQAGVERREHVERAE